FGDFKAGWIKTLDPDRPKDVKEFLTGLGNLSVVDLKVAVDGSLYYLRRLAWVRDHEFKAHTGVLYKIRYHGAEAPAYIAAEPADLRITTGEPAVFRVGAEGGRPLRFQWQRDGRDIARANGDTYTLRTVQRTDSGAQFRCVVRNSHAQVVSRTATLTV